MSEGRGCFKTGCLGCLGVFLVVIVITGVLVLIGWTSSRHRDMQDRTLAPVEARADSTLTPEDFDWRTHPGRVVLDLAHGAFILKPAPEGQGLGARARFDAAAYTIGEKFTVQPDSTWVYRISFRRQLTGVQAMFRGLFMKGARPEVQVFLPQDVPLNLAAHVTAGGMEAELGGLWLREADLTYDKGGFSVSFSEPLREPMERLSIHGAMGGLEAVAVGNASPAVLDVNCRMGGGDLDLSGRWLGDCRATLGVRMGGMSVTVPGDLKVAGADSAGGDMAEPAGENPLPVLHITKRASMGEIEIQR